MTQQGRSPLDNLKKKYSSNILNVYSLSGNGIPITDEARKTMEESARCYKDMDITEAMSFSHCQNTTFRNNIDLPLICNSEGEYQAHYNETIGPLTSDKSIPDGSITVDDCVNLVSVFRLSNLILEGYVCRKVQKLIYVAFAEYEKTTSLFYSKYPNKEINKINLHFYLWIPEITNSNKIKNVLKENSS